MKRLLPFVIVALVFAATLTAGGLLLRAKKSAEAEKVAAIAKQSKGKPGAEPPHVRGTGKPAVVLEEFADFECPPCGNMYAVLDKFEHDYAGRILFIFRHLPHTTHRHAFPAAYASEAAGMQDKFWEMHDLLFQERFIWQKAPDVKKAFEDYAAKLGLNLDRFRQDVESEKAKARVAADEERAKSLGFDATPSILINGKLVPPSELNPGALRAAIELALKQ